MLNRFLRILPAAMLLAAGLAAAPGHFVRTAAAQTESILAVVNGDVITRSDVTNRERLFALSTGMNMSGEVLSRLGPQVLRQLVDEKLRLQEIQRRKIVVDDQEIVAAIGEIEQRNNLPKGVLRARLASQGVAMRTLVDQIRVQLGWTRVLRQELGQRGQITPGEIDQRIEQIKAMTGKIEYNLAEIFIPVESGGAEVEAQKFADTVIAQLRAGAPFGLVAAQFSQSQGALEGGDLGWVQATQLDPQVAELVAQMPPGAVSNPIRVPGGFSIVTLRGKREVGHDMADIVTVREVFLGFDKQLDPANPTPQQRQTLEEAQKLQHDTRGCPAMEALAKQQKAQQPPNPGEMRADRVNNPVLRELVSSLPVGEPSRPLVAQDGIMLVMVCSRENRNVAIPSRQEVANLILNERVENISRQLMGDLRRKAVIQERS